MQQNTYKTTHGNLHCKRHVTMYDKTPGRMTSAQNETKYVASDLLGHNNKHIKCGNGRTTPCMKNIKIKHNTAYTDNLS